MPKMETETARHLRSRTASSVRSRCAVRRAVVSEHRTGTAFRYLQLTLNVIPPWLGHLPVL